MEWRLTVDWKLTPLPTRGNLRATLDAIRPVAVSLEMGRSRVVPWYERVLYKALGLRVVSASPLGGLHAEFTGDVALVTYALDDEDGLVATASDGFMSRDEVEFRLPNGERVREPGEQCISRSLALDLLEQFYSSGERPAAVVWRPRGKTHSA